MTSTRQLIVEPICGLGNRLLALAFAQRLAERSGRQLAVLWANSYPSQATQSNCRFEDLFEPTLPLVSSFDDIDRASLRRFVSFPRYMPWTPVEIPDAHPLESDEIDLEAHADVPVIGITSFNPLFMPGDDRDHPMTLAASFLLTLRPITEVDSAVQAFRRRYFTGPVLGVHIRRGDHGAMLARLGVPQPAEEDFWAYLDGCVDRRPALRLFCATDDVGVKLRLHRRYGERAASYPSASFDRRTPAGARAALIDLLLLSHADFLCGTPVSSFTQLASFRNRARRGTADACLVDISAGLRQDANALSALLDRTVGLLDLNASVSARGLE